MSDSSMDGWRHAYSNLEEEIAVWMGDPDRTNFGAIALKVFEFQRRHNPAYGKFVGDGAAPANWREIPWLPQSVFKQVAVQAFPDRAVVRTFETSGTTGEVRGRHAFCSLRLYEIAARIGWTQAGLGGRTVLSLISPCTENDKSSLGQMADWLSHPQDQFFRNGRIEIDALVRRVRATAEPVILFGTALAFLRLFEQLEDHPISLPQGSMAVETGGYKGVQIELVKRDFYARFETTLGLHPSSVVNEYGMTELSSQFYARGVDGSHDSPHWMRALVIDPGSGAEVADGKTGVLRIFDCANLGSVMAIQTQDLAIRRGNRFELIGRDPSALPRGCSRGADEAIARSDAHKNLLDRF